MSEPQPIGAGLQQARAALRAAAEPDHVPVNDDLDPEVVARDRQHMLDQQRWQRWSLVCPQRFHGANLQWTREQHGDGAADAIEEWATLAPRPNLILLGPVGTGKTGTALAAVRGEWIDRGVDVRFHPVTEALDLLRPGGPEHAMEELIDTARLILDDVGHERPTDWTAERFGILVNRRWMEERPVIATSNLEPEELRTAIGERSYSRLVGSDAVVVRLTGADRRRRAK